MTYFFCSKTKLNCLFYGLVFLFFPLASCKNRIDKKLPEAETYFLFKHVNEIVDENNITTGYQLLNSQLTKQEADTLKIILKKYGWAYKVGDGEIFISMLAMQDMDELFLLDSELEKRVSDSLHVNKE